MKTTVKFILFSVLLLVFLLTLPFLASAKSVFEVDCKNASYADAIYFYSYDAKAVLYSKNENKIIYPASTVKIMTGLIACEKLENRLNEQIAISDDMLKGHTGTSMGLRSGMTLYIKDLMYGAICGGANDAAQALAVICYGSVNSFVDEMNIYATRLGMSATVYKNPTGFDVNGAQTTIADIAILSKAAAKNSLYMEISSAKRHFYIDANGEEKAIYNRNALISHFTATDYLNEYAKGLNAGSTDKGGYVVSTIAKANGTSYLCIVMGAQNESREVYSYKIANELINSAVSKFGSVKISAKNEKISKLPVACALTTDDNISVSCITESDVYAFIPKDTDLKKHIEYRAYFHDTELIAPISEGDVLGGLNIYLDGVFIGSTRIIANEAVEENPFLVFMMEMKGFIVSGYFLIFAIIAIPSLAVFLYFDYMKFRRRKNIGYIKF